VPLEQAEGRRRDLGDVILAAAVAQQPLHEQQQKKQQLLGRPPKKLSVNIKNAKAKKQRSANELESSAQAMGAGSASSGGEAHAIPNMAIASPASDPAHLEEFSGTAYSSMPPSLQGHLHTLSDDLGKMLAALQPQVLVLQDSIKRICPDSGQDAKTVRSSSFGGATPHKPNALSPPKARAQKEQLTSEFVRSGGSFVRESVGGDVVASTSTVALGKASLSHRDSHVASPSHEPQTKAGLIRQMTKQLADSSNKKQKFAMGRNRAPLIPDIEEMKQHVREGARDESYSVFQRYHTSGVFQCIARSQMFDLVTLLVIFTNAVWIAVDADYNNSVSLYDADLVFKVAENAFCVYFFLELLVRFGAFRNKRDCFRDFWFTFDLFILCVMIFETWVLVLLMWLSVWDPNDGGHGASLFRLARLLRLCRIAKVTKVVLAMPELVVLVRGLIVGCRAATSSLTFIGVIVYVFAVIFRQLARDTALEAKFFGSIPDSMSTLLLTSVLPDHSDYFTEDFAEEPFYFGLLYFFFIILIAYVVLNLLVGVFVNVAIMVSTHDQEEIRAQVLRQELTAMLESLGMGDTCTISDGNFHTLVIQPGFCDILRRAGVDPVGLIENTKHILKDRGEIQVGALLELVLQLRGTNVATVRDLVDFRRLVSREFGKLEDRLVARTSLENITIADPGM